jgi:outer membrane protein assembly factor BamB
LSVPYPYHGPDNNPQSTDRLVRAPYLTQFLAEPKFCPSPAVTVAAGGRIFRACGHLAHQANQNALLNTLLAVNAYNGTILWKRPLKEGFMVLRNTIIATPQTLYLADDQSCKLLDTATGELKGEITSPDPVTDGTVWKWMGLEQGILCGLVGGEEFKAPTLRSDGLGLGSWPRANWPGFDYRDRKTAWGQGRTLFGVDVKTRKVLWRHQEQEYVDGRAVCLNNRRIYYLSPERFLACLHADTGTVAWRTTDPDLLKAIGPLFAEQPRWTGLSPFPYVRCNKKYLFFSGPRMPRVVAVSTDNGKMLWHKEVRMVDGGSVHLLLREDALYAVGETASDAGWRMDYATGQVLGRFLGRRGCTQVTGTVDSIFYRAPEGTVRIDLDSERAEHIALMRPPCYEGVIVADGQLHWGPWKCSCPLSLYGHVALTPAGNAGRLRGRDKSPLEFNRGNSTEVAKFPVHPDDWPCFQGDNQRKSTTRVAIPRKVSRQWDVPLTSAGRPTAPVAAGGLVFVGDESGMLRALDAASGRLNWKAHTGASIFFPPAVWEGRVYVGSADGYVYAFEASTGRLMWRFRAAPARRWIPVFGKLMSTWPVAGGVVVDNGVVYAAAGIADYDGTHVVALDAVTGREIWHNGTSGTLSRTTGSGISLQGGLYLADGQLCFPGGSVYPIARYELKTGQCVTPAEDRVVSHAKTAFAAFYPEYGQYMSLLHTLADGRCLSYAADYSGSKHTTLALFATLPHGVAGLPPDWRLAPKVGVPKTKPATVWEHKPGTRYNSFIVGLGTLLAAGQGLSAGQSNSFLAAVNIEDGSELWRHELPAPAVKGGAAIDHQGRVFVALQDGRLLSWKPSR